MGLPGMNPAVLLSTIQEMSTSSQLAGGNAMCMFLVCRPGCRNKQLWLRWQHLVFNLIGTLQKSTATLPAAPTFPFSIWVRRKHCGLRKNYGWNAFTTVTGCVRPRQCASAWQQQDVERRVARCCLRRHMSPCSRPE